MRARNASDEITVRTPFQKFHGPSYSARTHARVAGAASPTLAAALAARGRESVVPRLVRYLEGQRERGSLEFDDPQAAVDALIGLTIGDQQVRRLLGVLPMPRSREIEVRADRAVGALLTLFAPRRKA